MKVIISILLMSLGFTSLAQVEEENSSGNRAEKLKLSTFNVKWFGLGGSMWNDPSLEFRSEYLRRFIAQELSDSDVIVFTEVVNTNLLEQSLDKKYDCATYDATWDRHQHVMTCYNTQKYRAEKYDNDFIIEEVNLGSGGQRPATQTKICHRNGSCFLQVIGVHLAAGNKTEKRSQQVELLSENLKKLNKKLPTIITGDFNSYSKEQTGGQKDDITIFEEILKNNKQTFKSTTRTIKTYNSGDWARSYDHIVTTTDIKVISATGYLACEVKPDLRKKFIPYGSFRKYFSDHCPVTAEIVVPES